MSRYVGARGRWKIKETPVLKQQDPIANLEAALAALQSVLAGELARRALTRKPIGIAGASGGADRSPRCN